MAFNFFGTLSTGQWDEFVTFVNIQKVELKARRDWLSAQLSRNGIFTTQYDETTNMPLLHDADNGEGGFTCAPITSYGAKLLSAYRVLGGVPEYDMLLRTSDQPVFLTHGVSITSGEGSNNSGYSDVYSNGRRNRGSMRFDRDLGLLVEAVKRPLLESIKQKRERLEFKIKRALDYSDQLQNEINSIDKLIGNGSVVGTLDDLMLRVTLEMNSPGAFGVVDNPDDKFGLSIGRVADLGQEDGLEQAEINSERTPR